MEFSKDTTPMYNKYVNLVLNTLTSNEHEKYLHHLSKQRLQNVKQESTAPVDSQSTSLIAITHQSSDDSVEQKPPVTSSNSDTNIEMANVVTPT